MLLRRGIRLLFALAAAGCSRPAPAPSAGASSPAVSAGAVRSDTPRVMLFAGPLPPDTALSLPVRPEPTASYANLTVACDSVAAWMRAALDTSVVRRDSVEYQNEFAGGTRTGCVLRAAGRLSVYGQSGPYVPLDSAFAARGWVEARNYGADGPDGMIYGLRSRDMLCLVRFSWDGGDDSDSTYVPGDWYTLDLQCAPWTPADVITYD